MIGEVLASLSVSGRPRAGGVGEHDQQRVALLLTRSRRRYMLLTKTISFANPSALLWYCGSTALQTAMTQARETVAVLVADL
jgi:hypothetical protein